MVLRVTISHYTPKKEARMKKNAMWLTVGLILIVLSSGYAGGRAENTEQGATGASEEVELVFYHFGEKPEGYDEVWSEVNRILLERTRTTIRNNTIPWGDYRTKYNLLLNSGEEFDAIPAFEWLDYKTYAVNGHFQPLNDPAQEFAPESWAQLPPAAIEQASVEGAVYMLPSMWVPLGEEGWVVRDDLRTKYGIGPLETMEDFGEFLRAVKENEPGLVPFNAGTVDVHRLPEHMLGMPNDEGVALPVFFTYQAANPGEVYHRYMTEEYVEYARTVKEWVDEGLIPRSSLANETRSFVSFENGQSALALYGIDPMNESYADMIAANPNWEIEWYEPYPDTGSILGTFTQQGIVVPITSQYPDRVMAVLEEFRQDKELYRLAAYGIRGVHYDVDDNGYMVAVGSNPQYSGFDISVWAWEMPEFALYKEGAYPRRSEWLSRLAEKGYSDPLATMVFDPEPVASEIAAISDVISEYAGPLNMGLAGDVDDAIETFWEQMRIAGAEKVEAEMERQIAAFLAQ